MRTKNTCCGSNLRRRINTEKIPVLPNPKVQGGIAVIYIGAGNISFTGAVTHAIYYASDHSRHFKVHTEDAAALLKTQDIILRP
jgi:hypothetical protein